MNDFENKENSNATFDNRENTYRYSWDETATKQMPEEPKKKGGFGRKILVAGCCGLCFGLFGGLGLFAVEKMTEQFPANEAVYESSVPEKPETSKGVSGEVISTSGSENIQVVDTEQMTVAATDYSAMVNNVMPAMVSILNTTVSEITYWGQVYEEENQYSGSGIIIAENGEELLIATNYHVVAGATALEVNFIDGSVAKAQIKGTDADMDLAVIAIPLDKLSDETKQAIVIAKMGDSEALKLGEPVIAIGNALGYGQSVTTGCVSALNREVTMNDGSTGVFIQTDAAINPGNSGGALLNINGEVIGINSSKIGGSYVEGMGYAIPITAAEPIIGDLMNKETRYKVDEIGYMGTNLMTITEEQAYMYDFPQGLYVRGVEEGSPADKAGLLKGDILVKFDGERVKDYDALMDIMQYYGPETEVKLTVNRVNGGQYEEVELSIILGERPEEE